MYQVKQGCKHREILKKLVKWVKNYKKYTGPLNWGLKTWGGILVPRPLSMNPHLALQHLLDQPRDNQILASAPSTSLGQEMVFATVKRFWALPSRIDVHLFVWEWRYVFSLASQWFLMAKLTSVPVTDQPFRQNCLCSKWCHAVQRVHIWLGVFNSDMNL